MSLYCHKLTTDDACVAVRVYLCGNVVCILHKYVDIVVMSTDMHRLGQWSHVVGLLRNLLGASIANSTGTSFEKHQTLGISVLMS